MTEEVPKNSGFLKFIVIFMGILIVLGLGVVVWKVVDLAKQKAAREKRDAAQKELLVKPEAPVQVTGKPFAFDLSLESGERIIETSAMPDGLWIRIGMDGKTRRLILVNSAGKIIGQIDIKIDIKRDHEKIMPAK